MNLTAILISTTELTAEFTSEVVFIAELVSTSELIGELIE